MKKLLFLFLLFGINSNAQKISGIIKDSNTKKPLENAFIFIENSSISTSSKKDGSFQLDLLGQKNSIVINYMGYETYLISKDELNQNNVIIYLNPSEETLEDLIIQTSPFSRKEMMKVFKKYFLGNTANGKSCKILNEKDIILYFDVKTYTLFAESSEPIEIENKNLDYKIKFYLQDFQAFFNAKSLDFFNYRGSFFLGYSFYTDTSSNKKKSNEKRKKTYDASVPSFLKSLATGKLHEKNLRFYVDKFAVNTEDYFDVEESENGYVIHNIKKATKKYPKPPEKGQKILIIGGEEEGETIEVPINFNLYDSKTKNQSIIQLNSDIIEIDKFGNLLNPNQIYFGGYYGDLKLGDMLPIDFKY